jgi:rod shape-determining protein MreD
VKWKVYIGILLLIIPVQTIIMDHFSLGGIKPDLGLIAVYLIGIRMGETHGLMMGGMIGLLMDLFSGGMIGANLFTKPIAGWVSGVAGRTVQDVKILVSVGLLFCLSLFAGFFTYFFLEILKGGSDLFVTFRWIILPQALYDTVVGTIILSLIPYRWRMRKKAIEV